MDAISATYPFEREETYTFGKLRAFERELLAARRANPALSKAWRVPRTEPMKLAVKIREETYPLMLLANLKSYPDSARFRLMPYGFPGTDAIISDGTNDYTSQITIADPIWLRADGSPSNGGYDERLVREALNDTGIVHGLAAMHRDNGFIVSGKPVKSFNEEFEACVRGIESSLRKKMAFATPWTQLLVHARGYSMHTIDFPFSRVVDEAFDAIGRAKLQEAFGGYTFVDEGERVFFESLRN